jgi:hypothetical protein
VGLRTCFWLVDVLRRPGLQVRREPSASLCTAPFRAAESRFVPPRNRLRPNLIWPTFSCTRSVGSKAETANFGNAAWRWLVAGGGLRSLSGADGFWSLHWTVDSCNNRKQRPWSS